MKLITNVLLLLSFLIFFSCKKDIKEVENFNIQHQEAKGIIEVKNFDVEIEKKDCETNKRDVAAVFFENGFNKGDNVEVIVNNKVVFSGEITTDESLSLAKGVVLDNFSSIETLSIKVKNSQIISIEHPTCNFAYINLMEKDKILITFSSKHIAHN